MKTISNSVKAQLFALYLGQKVEYLGMIGELSFDRAHIEISIKGHNFLSEGILLLRRISDLTDEESIQFVKIIKISNLSKGIFSYEVSRADNKLWVTITRDYSHIKSASPKQEFWGAIMITEFQKEIYPNHITGIAIDYLRSIGIALPFTYLDENNHPITLSVEELVNLNWVKLK